MNPRHFRLHVPDVADRGSRPLVVVLHGGGGNAEIASKMGFSALAERENFIAVYPEAIGGHWNDGRDCEIIHETAGDSDDVGFIISLIDELRGRYRIDPLRIYAVGHSNGGMMCHRLGIEQAEVFAAIAPGIGGVPERLGNDKRFRPKVPVSVIILQGTDDPIVPYMGGELTANLLPALVGGKGRREDGEHGAIIPTDEAIRLWKRANEISGEPVV
jgi:polyhydroxybutyrate depolymerase